MAEHLYTTRALILGSTAVGEANRLADLFTESHGRLRAMARSVRNEKSKLRYHLEPLRFSTVSLVRGRDLWRIVGTLADEEALGRPRSRAALGVLGSAVKLLRRLLQGEEAAPGLFLTLSLGFAFLAEEDLSSEEMKNMECVLILRILYQLGYLGKEEPVVSYVGETPLSRELLSSVSPIRRAAIAKINKSLNASSL